MSSHSTYDNGSRVGLEQICSKGYSRRAQDGGERGIRTLGRVSPTHAFQACSFNHSDISPCLWNLALTGTRIEPKRQLCPGLCPNPVGVSVHLTTNQVARGRHHAAEPYCASSVRAANASSIRRTRLDIRDRVVGADRRNLSPRTALKSPGLTR